MVLAEFVNCHMLFPRAAETKKHSSQQIYRRVCSNFVRFTFIINSQSSQKCQQLAVACTTAKKKHL